MLWKKYLEEFMTKKTYLYLARRDKKGVKILTVLSNAKDNFTFSRIKDIKSLGLPNEISIKIEEAVYTDRMMWEPFIECTENYGNLKTNLQSRGYSNVPIHFSPTCPLEGKVDSNKQPYHPQPAMPTKPIKTMLRKKK